MFDGTGKLDALLQQHMANAFRAAAAKEISSNAAKQQQMAAGAQTADQQPSSSAAEGEAAAQGQAAATAEREAAAKGQAAAIERLGLFEQICERHHISSAEHSTVEQNITAVELPKSVPSRLRYWDSYPQYTPAAAAAPVRPECTGREDPAAAASADHQAAMLFEREWSADGQREKVRCLH